MHFCWKRDRVTLWNKLGFTEFHFGNFINFHHLPLQTGIHRHGIFGKRLPSGKVETGWNVVVKLYTSHSLGRWILYSPCIPSQVRAGTMSDFAVHLSSSASSASSVSLLQVKWDRAGVLVMKILEFKHWLVTPWLASGWVVTLHLGSHSLASLYHWEEHHKAASESMHQWMGLDTRSETYRISAKRNGNVISIYSYVYMYSICLCNMYIHSSLFSPHITQPLTQHPQIHQTCHQFSSAYQQNSCEKSRAMQHGTLSLGHVTIPTYNHSKELS